VELKPEEIRVLGCLLEKERTTPDAYPLSLNGLVSACNQTTNRDPVVHYRDDEVELALDGLRAHGLVRRGVYPGSRVIKYRHCTDEALDVGGLDVGGPGQAVLAVLLLRGPQTSGELKARTERLHPFADLAAVEDAVDGLVRRDVPLVERLEREPGRKEARWSHRLGSEAAPGAAAAPETVEPAGARSDLEARVAALEVAVAELTERLDR
jgi:uncharacterized protein YceH (UPF0502 family)